MFYGMILFCSANLTAQIYSTKHYKWTKLASIDGTKDTSDYIYSKIQKSSNGILIIGGRGYYTLYQRSIYQSDDNGKSWQIAFPQNGSYIDYIIDSNDKLIITGMKKDSLCNIYIKDLHTNIVDTINIINEKNMTFTRPREYINGKYFIKANDQVQTYLLIFDSKEKSLTQLIPRQSSDDSLNIAIDKDLMSFQDYTYDSKSNTILISTFNNLYSTTDLFKNIKLCFFDKEQFSIYKQIELNDGKFIYSHVIRDSLINETSIYGLFGYDEKNNSQKTYLLNYLNVYGGMNPITLMACSNNNYIVCKLGCSSYGFGFSDTLNIDSLMISDDFGETFSFVPMPILDTIYDYNYYAYASPSVTKKGEIFLVLNPRISNKPWPNAPFVYIYYGVPDDVGIQEIALKKNSLYPNPVSDFARLQTNNEFSGFATIEIVDLLGNSTEIYRGNVNRGVPLDLNFTHFPSGFYTLIIDYRTKRAAIKFVKI